MAKNTVKYYSNRRKLVEGGFRNFPVREIVCQYRELGGVETGEAVKFLRLKSVSGEIKRREDAFMWLKVHMNREEVK